MCPHPPSSCPCGPCLPPQALPEPAGPPVVDVRQPEGRHWRTGGGSGSRRRWCPAAELRGRGPGVLRAPLAGTASGGSAGCCSAAQGCRTWRPLCHASLLQQPLAACLTMRTGLVSHGPSCLWGSEGCFLGGRGSGPGRRTLWGRQLDTCEATRGCSAGGLMGAAACTRCRCCRTAGVSHLGEMGQHDRVRRWRRSSRWGEPLEFNILLMLSGTCSVGGVYCQAVRFAPTLSLPGAPVVCR